jgi:serine/threonine protein kinase
MGAQGCLSIVTEYMALGNLHMLLKRGTRPVGWPVRVRMGIDVASGLAFLHAQSTPVLHLDLKSPNLLVDEHFRVKLADFGLAMYKKEDAEVKKKEAFQVSSW